VAEQAAHRQNKNEASLRRRRQEHLWGLERVVRREVNVHHEYASRVGAVTRPAHTRAQFIQAPAGYCTKSVVMLL
jgi:hypothetical protein